LRTHIPGGEFMDALRAQKLLSVAAGENVTRLLPPLIVTEAEIGEAITRIDRACAALAQKATSAKQGAAG
jgi:acetylornithine/N-succinyldiaminopimelate aminotransferase